MTTHQILQQAKAAVPVLMQADTETKNQALLAMADALVRHSASILQANAADLEAARSHISTVMLDRLALSESRIAAMAEGIRQVAALPDPIGHVHRRVERPNGLIIEQVCVPMGVVAIIYESRPNVTSDAAALALKSGNVCVLRGGKEAFRSANAIVTAMQEGLLQCGLPAELVQLVQDTSRASAQELMTAVGYVDLLIPRGGAGLIRAVTENAKVPCIQTGTGICHIYVDKDARKYAWCIVTSLPVFCRSCGSGWSADGQNTPWNCGWMLPLPPSLTVCPQEKQILTQNSLTTSWPLPWWMMPNRPSVTSPCIPPDTAKPL